MSRGREATAAFATLAAGALSEVTVRYAAQVTGDYQDRVLWVAYDGNSDGPFLAYRSAEEWAGIGRNSRDETLTFPNALLIQRGEDELDELSDEIYGLFDDLSDALRLNPSMGMTPGPVVAEISQHQFLVSEAQSSGVVARIEFVVQVQARIY